MEDDEEIPPPRHQSEDKTHDPRYWRKKLKRLQRTIKHQVFINAALHDEVSYMEQQLVQSKSERKVLLKRLFQHLPMTESQVLQSTHALKALESTFPGKIPPSILSPVTNAKDPLGLPTMKKRDRKRPPRVPVHPPVDTSKSSSSSKTSDGKTASKTISAASSVSSEKDVIGKGEDKTPESPSEPPKPKRKKPGSVPKKIQPITMNSQGVPIFPITLGTLTVHDLGQILPHKPGFHSERYIWPVGFCSTRVYPSMTDPTQRIQYFCYIKDGGKDQPVFEIVAEDEPDKPITAVTATACHCVALKRLNKARGKDATNTGSGPEFFGFSNPTIQYLIQCLPGAEACEKYVRQTFEYPSQTKDTPQDVLHENNLPAMYLHERSKLNLPHPTNITKLN